MLENYYSTYDVNNNKIENTLLSIKQEQQHIINHSNHPIYNEFQEKLIEIIDDILINTPQVNEENIIDRLTDNLQIRNNIVSLKKKNTEDINQILQYRLEQECINYLLYIVNNSKKDFVEKSNLIDSLTCRIKKCFNRGLTTICMLNSLENKI